MKKTFRKLLFGITLPQEYLCVKQNDFVKPLKVYAADNSSGDSFDVTSHHLFIGYKPLVLAVDKKYLKKTVVNLKNILHLSFRSEEKNELASLEVKFVHEVNVNSASFVLFEAVKGEHSFSRSFQQLFSSIYYRYTADKKKNIFLPGNLYDQVKIAYSIPRLIYTVSVGSSGLYNVFPTDLSGQLGNENFIISLRTIGKANEQIENSGKCMIAKIDADYFTKVYSIGRNHMRKLSNVNELGIKLREERSTILRLPIPLGTLQYFELEKFYKFEIGIHTIHFLRIINSVQLSDSQKFLMHIHREYAEWRIRNGINTNYLIRK